jgi:DNA-directed RNA polymerase subunit RPC12/RpoP
MTYTTGEKPGVGTYRCTKCGELVRLDDYSDRLPPCPSCYGTQYIKIN